MPNVCGFVRSEGEHFLWALAAEHSLRHTAGLSSSVASLVDQLRWTSMSVTYLHWHRILIHLQFIFLLSLSYRVVSLSHVSVYFLCFSSHTSLAHGPLCRRTSLHVTQYIVPDTHTHVGSWGAWHWVTWRAHNGSRVINFPYFICLLLHGEQAGW